MSPSFRLLFAGTALATGAALLGAAGASAAPAFTTLDPLSARGQIAARNTVTVITQIDKNGGAELWVGKGGNLPELVPGAIGVPSWAQPHVGTDAARKPVVIYPSCADVAHTESCDLKQYDVLTGKISIVAGVNTSSAGETEGTSDRGAIVAARWTDKEDPWPLSAGGYNKTTTTLVYRAAGKPAKVLTKSGGQQLSLDRGRVLFVHDGLKDDGVCGRPQVRLLRVDTGAVRTVAQHTCGLDGQTIEAPTFFGKEIVYGLRTYGESSLRRVAVTGGTSHIGKVKGGFAAFAPTSRSGGVYVDGDFLTDIGSPEDAASKWALKKVTGVSFTG